MTLPRARCTTPDRRSRNDSCRESPELKITVKLESAGTNLTFFANPPGTEAFRMATEVIRKLGVKQVKPYQILTRQELLYAFF